MISFNQNTLRKPRIRKLELKKVYERKYNKNSNISPANSRKTIYLYELVFGGKAEANVNELNIIEQIENDDPDVITMATLSRLQLDGGETLGFIKDSLLVKGKVNSTGETEQSLDYIDILLNIMNNTIEFEYFIVDFHEVEIKFKIMIQNELNINLLRTRDIKIDSDAYTFHRNGFTKENNCCYKLHQGFHKSSIQNQSVEIGNQVTNMDEISQALDMSDTCDLSFPPIMAGSSRKRTVKRSFTAFMSGLIPNINSSTNGNSIEGRKILLFIDHLNHPSFMVFMNIGRKVVFLKQTLLKTLERFSYSRCQLNDIRLIFNANQLGDEKTLVELFKNLPAVRISVVMNKPYIISTMTSRIDSRSQGQNETIYRYKICWILLRNIQACNRAAETYLEPNQRIRFNEPIIEIKGIIFAEHFGKLITNIADEMRRLSINLLKMANIMIKDENMVPHSIDYNNYKYLIQNLMNAARYAAPLFKTMSKFVIPLPQQSPRQISFSQ